MKRFPLFKGSRPFQWSEVPKNLLAGITLAAMNIPQSLGYTRIAGIRRRARQFVELGLLRSDVLPGCYVGVRGGSIPLEMV